MRVIDIELESHEYQRNPWDVYAYLRNNKPVFWSEANRSFYISKDSLIRDILMDRDHFTAEHVFRTTRHLFGPTIIDMEGEHHQRIRAALGKKFKSGEVNTVLEGIINEVVQKRFDRLGACTELEVISGFAAAIPIGVIMRILGLPVEHSDWVFTVMRPIMRYLDNSKESMTQALTSADQLQAYILETIRLTPSFEPGSLLAELLPNPGSELLTEAELVRHVMLLLSAGTDTTMGTIANVITCLLRNPETLKELQQDTELLPRVIKETLRLEPPLHSTLRIAKEKVVIQDVTIPKGSAVQLLLASANRDEEIYDHADRWDIYRREKHTMAFGAGSHHCIGTLLAQKELELIFKEFFKRYVIAPRQGLALPEIRGRSFRCPQEVFIQLEPACQITSCSIRG
ncbi:cytochrome P450 [Paenibacillus sp. JSM ZJ436]|uniref:cytochrome P450 n=1 Tax=Paenibacillus sp. JSM ZJ436 TaxID=3376190 RepID=UPI00378AE787